MAIATRTLKDTALESGSGAQGGKVTILVNMDPKGKEHLIIESFKDDLFQKKYQEYKENKEYRE